MTVFEVEGSPRLELPDEPVDLQRELRDTLLSGANWREGFSDDICIGLLLWRAWQPALEPLGFSREDFIDSVVAYRRELWLWLMGDRRLDPLRDRPRRPSHPPGPHRRPVTSPTLESAEAADRATAHDAPDLRPL